MRNPASNSVVSSSFRDPDGFLFWQRGRLYRQINLSYKENYDHLKDSGLYQKLITAGLLVPHDEVDVAPHEAKTAYKVIRPELISFISYPYEWCFSQLKNAALALLSIQKISMDFGMSLKDGSAYNLQFLGSRPVLIDTLSFEKYREGSPWVAYRQFCQHFLAPLALMSLKDIRLNQLLRIYIDGVPLDLASSLLPASTRLKFSLLTHIHLHAQSQKRYAARKADVRSYKMGRNSFLGLIDSLESAVKNLKWRPSRTEWADYYEDTNYSREGFEHKKEVVAQFLTQLKPGLVWDLGSNLGIFSRLASDKGIFTVSLDFDPAAVEKNYLESLSRKETLILPLVSDLANPSPGIGWENLERMSLIERGPADTVIALALIHHLAISNNVPLEKMAGFFSRICKNLIIEFVPKNDSQVHRLLVSRDDIFQDYSKEAFEREFGKYFAIQESVAIKNSVRTLYLMQKEMQ